MNVKSPSEREKTTRLSKILEELLDCMIGTVGFILRLLLFLLLESTKIEFPIFVEIYKNFWSGDAQNQKSFGGQHSGNNYF